MPFNSLLQEMYLFDMVVLPGWMYRYGCRTAGNDYNSSGSKSNQTISEPVMFAEIFEVIETSRISLLHHFRPGKAVPPVIFVSSPFRRGG